MVTNQPSKLVAVVVPLSNREELTPAETISFNHLTHFLGNYDKYLVAPKSLQINYSDFTIKRFDNRFFGSAAAYNKLMLIPKFYEAFIDYKFILLYHLDSLVFSDDLIKWCERDFDYIGAPWIKFPDAPYAGMPAYEGKVGNGGFSLRKIRSFLKVFDSKTLETDPIVYWKENFSSKPAYVQVRNFHKRFLKRMRIFNSVRWELSRYTKNEEHFWANRATHYYPQLKIAPVDVALAFAFEYAPRLSYRHNNYRLPFGCHAWEKYDREFWKPYLINDL